MAATVLPVLRGTVTAGERFCEACGAELAPARAPSRGAAAERAADDRLAPATSRWRLRTSRRTADKPSARGPAVSAAGTSPTTATARSAAPGGQPARPLHRAARAMGGSRVRSGHPPQAKRGRRRPARWARAREPCRPGGLRRSVVLDGLRCRQPGGGSRRPRRAGRLRSPGAGHGRHPRRGDRKGTRVCRRRGQRGRRRPHLGGPQPRVVHLRGRGGRRVAPRRGLGR